MTYWAAGILVLRRSMSNSGAVGLVVVGLFLFFNRPGDRRRHCRIAFARVILNQEEPSYDRCRGEETLCCTRVPSRLHLS